MTYLKYARGFKSGGWNPSAPSLEAAGPADPEIVDEFEFGLKADFFDRHLRTNLAAFTYSFDGLQSTLSQIIDGVAINNRSEEHTSELQSLMRISYAVFCLKKKKKRKK